LEEKKRILILCIDRDNDIGSKINVETPIIGYEENLKAACEFALASPEDSDVNAMFSMLRLKGLVEREYPNSTIEVATVTGHPSSGIKADSKISREIDIVISKFKPDGIIVVSDGIDDEFVLPIIQRKASIISIHRTIVQQSPRIEATYILLGKYFRKIIEEPRLSKIFIGFPGILILIFAILSLLKMESIGWIVFGIIVGLFMVVKGLSIDKILTSWFSTSPIMFIASITAIISYVIGIYISLQSIIDFAQGVGISKIMENIPLYSSLFIEKISGPVILGTGIVLAAKAVIKYIEHNPKLWHNIVGIVFLVMMYPTLLEISRTLIHPGLSEILLYWLSITAALCFSLIVIFSLSERVIFRQKAHS
jgi:putative membrane protein